MAPRQNSRRARRHARRDERGAVAVLFAVLAVVLLGVGALVVDIGHAYATRSLLQTDVDLAVLAAAAELDNPGACNTEVLDVALTYLTKSENAVPGQDLVGIDLGGSAGDGDGYLECSDWTVRLVAPASTIDLGLGRVVSDEESLELAAEATAQIRSPGANATLPFFAVSGCDSGEQTIRDDSGPVAPAPVPPLTPDSAAHHNATFALTTTETPSGTVSLSLTLSGTQLNGTTAIGFTGVEGPPAHVTATPSSVSPTSVVVSVPASVLATDGVWYVRVYKAASAQWSRPERTQRLTVGEEKLFCDASLEGNFGTIDLPRTDTNAFPLEWNMIEGIEPTLALHPAPAGQCDGQAGSVLSGAAPVDGTNCLLSEPGLKVAQTNAGLVTGKGGKPGRLDTGSTSGCSRSGDDARTTTALLGTYLNDDVLSCFLTDDAASLGDLVSGTGAGEHALSPDVFGSPRYFVLPVVDSDPATGAKHWPIIGFRAGFVTDQALTATRASPGVISQFNGLTAEPSGIREIRVLLFSDDALPEFAPATGDETDYVGSGPKVVVLVE